MGDIAVKVLNIQTVIHNHATIYDI